MINAKAETVHERPAYKAAFRSRRCAIPAAGFYEWRKRPDGKQPYYIFPRTAPFFLFAGLWERWNRDDRELESTTILTTEPNAIVGQIHNRMPTILDPEALDAWLDPATEDADELRALAARQIPADETVAVPIRTLVNNPTRKTPRLPSRSGRRWRRRKARLTRPRGHGGQPSARAPSPAAPAVARPGDRRSQRAP